MARLTRLNIYLCCLAMLIGTTLSEQLATPGFTTLSDSSSGVGAPGALQSHELPDPETLTLTNGITLLMLPAAEDFQQLEESCNEYLAKTMIFTDTATLEEFSLALNNMIFHKDTGFWVGINGFKPTVFTSKCYLVHQNPDFAVCFKDTHTFYHVYPHCAMKADFTGDVYWNLDPDDCPQDMFRPVCNNGLSCMENTQDLCGAWLIGCPFHGQCLPDEIVSPGLKTCRFPPPTVRIVISGADDFTISCEIHEDCLKKSYSLQEWSNRKKDVSINYYQDGNFFTKLDNIEPLKFAAGHVELDSEFQCEYMYTDVSSRKSHVVSRPKVESEMSRVPLGGPVDLTCLDSGVEEISEEFVTFEWEMPSNPLLPTADEMIHLASFTQDNAGDYKCRSVVDSQPSVWSKPKKLEVAFKVPELTASELQASYGSIVILVCTADNLLHGFSYVFYKDGTLIKKEDTLHEYVIASFTLRNIGSYYCTVEKNSMIVGPSNSVILDMKQIFAPVLVTSRAETVREGKNVTLTCNSVIKYRETVQYSFFFQSLTENATLEIIAEPSSELIISNFTAEDEGSYECFVNLIDDNGTPFKPLQTSNVSNSVTLRMISAILQSTATTVPEGSDVKLTCNITNYLGAVELYRWLKEQGQGSVAFKTTMSNSTIIKTFKPANIGVYRCQAILSDPTLRDPPLLSRPVELVTATRYQNCPCVCSPQVMSLPPVTPNVVEESKTSIQKNLSVARAGLSSRVRRVSSAPDDRPSSVSAGYVAVALLCLVAMLVLIPDLISVVMVVNHTWHRQEGQETASVLGKSDEGWAFPKPEAT